MSPREVTYRCHVCTEAVTSQWIPQLEIPPLPFGWETAFGADFCREHARVARVVLFEVEVPA